MFNTLNYSSIFVVITLIQIFAVKQKQCNNTTTNGCICKIEYRTEEYKMLATNNRHPHRPGCIDDGKIEHIDHLAIEPGWIPPFSRQECSNGRIGALVKKNTVKYAIYYISECTCKYQWHTYYITRFGSLFYCFIQIPGNKPYGNNTKTGEKQFTEYFHTESHSVVLCKVNIKPICNMNTLMKVHIGFHNNLNNLVNEKHRNDYE